MKNLSAHLAMRMGRIRPGRKARAELYRGNSSQRRQSRGKEKVIVNTIEKIWQVQSVLRNWEDKRVYETSDFLKNYPNDQEQWMRKLAEIDSLCLEELKQVSQGLFSNP